MEVLISNVCKNGKLTKGEKDLILGVLDKLDIGSEIFISTEIDEKQNDSEQ